MAREWVKNKLGTKGVKDYAGELRTAVQALEEEGVLTVIKSPESPPSRRRRREEEAVEGEREAGARRKGRRLGI